MVKTVLRREWRFDAGFFALGYNIGSARVRFQRWHSREQRTYEIYELATVMTFTGIGLSM